MANVVVVVVVIVVVEAPPRGSTVRATQRTNGQPVNSKGQKTKSDLEKRKMAKTSTQKHRHKKSTTKFWGNRGSPTSHHIIDVSLFSNTTLSYCSSVTKTMNSCL